MDYGGFEVEGGTTHFDQGTCFGSWKLIVFVALKLVPCRSHAFSPQHFRSLPSANHNGRDEIGAGH